MSTSYNREDFLNLIKRDLGKFWIVMMVVQETDGRIAPMTIGADQKLCDWLSESFMFSTSEVLDITLGWLQNQFNDEDHKVLDYYVIRYNPKIVHWSELGISEG